MGGTLGENAPLRYNTRVGEHNYSIVINDDHHVTINGAQYEVDFQTVTGQALFSIIIGGKSHAAHVELGDSGWLVLHKGNLHNVQVEDERSLKLAQLGADDQVLGTSEFKLKAPMPGLVISVPVSEGEEVSTGDILVILESMKMQNELRAPQDGVITRVRVQSGESVEHNQIMIVLS